MSIRQAKIEDFDRIKDIFQDAIRFMRKNGNLVQWKDSEKLFFDIKNDISNGNFYVYEDLGEIKAGFCFSIGEDPTYVRIYDGSWLNDKPYGVIHRIAVASFRKGIASECIRWCFDRFPNIKIDTHSDNIFMQKLIDKCGFSYCGLIKKEDGSDRLAYQKTK